VLRMVVDVVVSAGELMTEEEDELETTELMTEEEDELETTELVNDVELVLELEALELGEDNIVEVLLEVLLDTLRVDEVEEVGVVDWPGPTLLVVGNIIDKELEVGGNTRLGATVLEIVVESTVVLVLLAGRTVLLPAMLLAIVEGGGGISECRDVTEAN
jgi:hypothetical protein